MNRVQCGVAIDGSGHTQLSSRSSVLSRVSVHLNTMSEQTTTKTWAQSVNDAMEANVKAHGPGVIIGAIRNDG